MKRTLVLAALLGLILLAVVASGYQAVADPTGAPVVGQVLRLESVRGMARDPSSGESKNATLTLTLTTAHINNTRVRFMITGGIGHEDNRIFLNLLARLSKA